jgi:hypothetical protein
MLPATTISPSNPCFSFETSCTTSPARTVDLFQSGSLRVEETTYLGMFVQPVRQFAAPGWPPRGEELVGSPTEQLGLGAQRLLGSRFPNILQPTMPLRSRPGTHIGVEALSLHALRRGVNVGVPGLLPGAHSRLYGQQKAPISGALMELAGLEPATSWVRSTQLT